MQKILIVEDDAAMRGLMRERLADSFEILETDTAAAAVEQILQHRPDCILLDLVLPDSSGLELSQTLSTLTVTQEIPVVVVTGQPASEFRPACIRLGAADYLEKPVDFKLLRNRLTTILRARREERRKDPRVRLRVMLRLQGKDVVERRFNFITTSDNVSVGGFLCGCPVSLKAGTIVDVSLIAESEHRVGPARVVRFEWCDDPRQRYGFEFLGKPEHWIVE